MAIIIVDSDILIDAANEEVTAVAWLQNNGQSASLAISVITQMELTVGCRNKRELRKLDKFLQNFQVLKLTEPISDKAVDLLRRYRLSHGLDIPDALIAATAIEHNQPFASKNQRDYRFIAGLNLLPYP